jgi:hypothetical protein
VKFFVYNIFFSLGGAENSSTNSSTDSTRFGDSDEIIEYEDEITTKLSTASTTTKAPLKILTTTTKKLKVTTFTTTTTKAPGKTNKLITTKKPEIIEGSGSGHRGLGRKL